MSETAARPWWADVQHLRPDDDGDHAASAAAPARTGRFARSADGASATEHGARRASSPAPTRQRGDTRTRDAEPRPRRFDREPAQRRDREPAQRREETTEPRRRPEVDLRPRGAAFAEYRDGRRTVSIRGQVDRVVAAPAAAPGVAPERRRPRRTAVERLGGRPDRVAMWAVMLGLLLILVAAISSPGAGA